MKKFLRTLLCGAMLALTMSATAFAAEGDLLISPAPEALPERQGDFYVMVNGEFVTFPDAVPQAKDNRSFLPMAATFSQLGFAEEDMTWNTEGLITATKDDLTVALTLGKNEIVLTKGEETSTISTDVAPYVDPATWRTYIPFGLVAEALGYNAGWDSYTGTVIIDDVDAIMAAKGETYELMNKYLEYNQSFYEKNQKVSGSYAMEMDLSIEDENVSFVVDGDYEMLTSSSTAAQFETDMTMDMELIMEGVDVIEEALAESEAPISLPVTVDMDMRYDLETGVFYFKSEALCEMLGQPDMANAWFKLDLAAMVNDSGVSGITYESLIQETLALAEDMTFEEYLTLILKMTEPTSIYATTSDVLDGVNALFGDSAFQKSGSKYVNTLEDLGLPMSLTLYTSGSKVNGYDIEMNVEDSSLGVIEVSCVMKNSKMDMSMLFDMSDALTEIFGDGKFIIEMTMDGTYRSTNTAPATEPPAGAVVIDLMELMEAQLGSETITLPAS